MPMPDIMAATERAMANADAPAEPPMDHPADVPADPFVDLEMTLDAMQLTGADVASALAPLKAENPDLYGRILSMLVEGGAPPMEPMA